MKFLFIHSFLFVCWFVWLLKSFSGCLGTHSRPRDPPASASLLLRLKVCAITNTLCLTQLQPISLTHDMMFKIICGHFSLTLCWGYCDTWCVISDRYITGARYWGLENCANQSHSSVWNLFHGCCNQALNSVLNQKARVPELALSISHLGANPKLPLAADLSTVEINKHKLCQLCQLHRISI